MIRHRWQRTFRLRAGILAVAALAGIACLVRPAFTSGGCPASVMGSFPAGQSMNGVNSSFTLTFQSRTYDAMADQTTVCYTLDASPDNETLNHFVIELCPDLRAALVPSNDYEAVNPDPTTGISGVKFDNDPGEGTYCFTVNGNWALGCTTATLKKGDGPAFPTGPIQGLACTEVSTLTLTCPGNIRAECGCQDGKTVTFAAPTPSGGTPPYTIVCRDQNQNLVQSGDLFPLGDTNVTCTVTDADGATATCTFRIRVIQDTTRPAITCPVNATVECPGSTDPAATGTATATDACDTSPDISYTDVVTPGNCEGRVVTRIVRTWKAVDDCGNMRTCDQNITVRDTTDPVITCPAHVTVDCGSSTDPSATGEATATDTCDSTPTITFADTEEAGSCPGTKVITRRWTAEDDCGNRKSCNQRITVRDITPPVITCPVNATVECPGSTAPAATGEATATDACDSQPSITYSDEVTPGNCENKVVRTIVRTWTAKDDCNNSSSCTQTITVRDTTAPRLTCPSLDPVDAGTLCQATIPDVCALVASTATDGCTPGVRLPCSQTPAAGTQVGAGEHTITLTVTDNCGNIATCTTTFEVTCDDILKITCPVRGKIEVCSDDGADTKAGDCGAVVTYGTPTVMGGAEPVVVSCQPPSGSLFPVGKTKVTCTATDANGQTANCSFNVIVKDCEAPVCKAPAYLTVDAGIWCKAYLDDLCAKVTKKDNCGAENLTCVQSPAPGTLLDAGTHTVTFTVTDKAGNSTTCTTKVKIECQRELEVTCPVPYRIEACSDEGYDKKPGDCGAVVTYGAPTVTGGKQPVTVSCTPKSGSFFPVGTTKVTCIATDANGVKDLCSFYVIVTDCEAPVCNAGYPIKVTGDANCKAKVPDLCAKASKSDNCTPSGSLTCTQYPKAGTVVGHGTHTITLTVTDKAGNTSTCTTTFTVECRSHPPLEVNCPVYGVLTLRSHQGADAQTGDCGAVVTFDAPTVTGGKQPVIVSCTPKSGSFFPVGTTRITCTAIDADGNKATCYFNITVKDSEAPTCIAPAHCVVDGDAYCKAKLPNLCGLVTKTDNCTSSAYLTCTQYPKAGTVLGKGTHTITFTVTDKAGNKCTSTTTFTVQCGYKGGHGG